MSSRVNRAYGFNTKWAMPVSVSEGMSAEDAVRNTVSLALRLEACGYHRFWLAEHHSDRLWLQATGGAHEPYCIGDGSMYWFWWRIVALLQSI